MYHEDQAASWCGCRPSLWSAPLCCPAAQQPESEPWFWFQSVWTGPAGHWASGHPQTRTSSPWKCGKLLTFTEPSQRCAASCERFQHHDEESLPFTVSVSSISQLHGCLKGLADIHRAQVHSSWEQSASQSSTFASALQQITIKLHAIQYSHTRVNVLNEIPPVSLNPLVMKACSGNKSVTRANPARAADTWNDPSEWTFGNALG